MFEKAIQDYYPAESAICYGCGRNNPHGLHIKTFWDGSIGLCHFTPRPEHTAYPGIVYGGILASIIDCHCIGTAIAAMYQAQGLDPETDDSITCVTGNLNVTYRKPTPTDTSLVLKASIKELGERKAIVVCSLYAEEVEAVSAELVAVRIASRSGNLGHHPPT